MQRMARRIALVGLLLTLILAVAPQAPAQTSRRPVVLGFTAEPDVLNPLATNTISAAVANRTFLDPLVEYDLSLQLRPVMVEAIPSLENGLWKLLPGGKMELTWRLRSEYKWQDGRPVTSADVAFTHEAATNPKVPVGQYLCGVKDFIEKVATPDVRTFVVTWKSRYAFAAECPVEGARYGIVPKHIFEDAYKRNPESVKDVAYGQDPAVTIGNGAYRFVRRVRGSEIVVEANPTYWRGKPQIDQIVFRYFPDANTIIANMLAGSVHVAVPQPAGINFGQAMQLDELVQRGEARDVRVGFRPVAIHEVLWFNQANPIVRDRRIRQALAYATNREEISEALFRSRQPAAHLFLPPTNPMVEKDVRQYPYDPARARSLLAEAGWRVGPDGVLVNAQGQRLQLVVMTTAGNRDRERLQLILVQQWREVGIEVLIENAPPRLIFGDLFEKRQYKAILLGSHPMQPLQNAVQFYSSREMAAVGTLARNPTGWSLPQTDALLDQFVQEPDRNKRKAILSQFQKIWAEELPVLPLYFWVSGWAYNVNLQGFEPTGVALYPSPVTWNARLWRWRQ